MSLRGGPPAAPPMHRRHRLFGVALVAGALGLGAGCSSSGDLSQSDFEAVITESRIGNEVGPVVAADYADCLYGATNGDVADLVDHIDDDAYQPSGPTADALAACSDVLFPTG